MKGTYADHPRQCSSLARLLWHYRGGLSDRPQRARHSNQNTLRQCMERTGMAPVVRRGRALGQDMRHRAIGQGSPVLLRAAGRPSRGPRAKSWGRQLRAKAGSLGVSFRRWMWALWCSEGHYRSSWQSRRPGSLMMSRRGAGRRDQPRHATSRGHRVLWDPNAGGQHVCESLDKLLMKR